MWRTRDSLRRRKTIGLTRSTMTKVECLDPIYVDGLATMSKLSKIGWEVGSWAMHALTAVPRKAQTGASAPATGIGIGSLLLLGWLH